MLRKRATGIQFNERLAQADAEVMFHACEMGLEGFVSMRLGPHYRSGRLPDWLKANPF